MSTKRHLNAIGKGLVDYDYKNDILFFKVKDKEYKKSIDFGDIILDIDSEDYITGIQLFEASKFFNIDKVTLRTIRRWRFDSQVEEGVITVKLNFEMVRRNRVIVEKGQNLVREATSPLRNSSTLCRIEA